MTTQFNTMMAAGFQSLQSAHGETAVYIAPDGTRRTVSALITREPSEEIAGVPDVYAIIKIKRSDLPTMPDSGSGKIEYRVDLSETPTARAIGQVFARHSYWELYVR